nr:RecName: Full=Antimicrobial ribonuclease [Lentinus sajor-caju]
DNGEAGRAAR